MVSEVKDLNGEDLLKQFECSHHAFMTRYLDWKEMPETKMEVVLRNMCLVQLIFLTLLWLNQDGQQPENISADALRWCDHGDLGDLDYTLYFCWENSCKI